MTKGGRSKNAPEKMASTAAVEKNSDAGPQEHTQKAATQASPEPSVESVSSAAGPDVETDEANADGPGNIDETAVAQVLALNGWSLEHLRGRYWLCNVQNSAKIASPFANMGDRSSELMQIISTELPLAVRILYEEFREHLSQLKSQLLSGNSISDSGRTGHFGVLQQNEYVSFFEEDVEENEQDEYIADKSLSPEVLPWDSDCNYCNLPLDEIAIPAALEKASTSQEMAFYAGKRLYIRRYENAATGVVGYFIVNADDLLITVNDQTMGQKAIIGPLPSFAVISTGPFAIFWWRTPSAMNYLPSAKPLSLKRKQPIDESLANAGDEEASSKRRKCATWLQTLEDGLARHRRHKEKRDAQKKDKYFSEIKSSTNMGVDDVLVGIAPIWEALRLTGTEYAYAGVDVFDPVSEDGPSLDLVGSVGGPNKFIMPMLLPGRSGSTTGSIGHLVLGVAEMIDPKDKKVRIDFYDSHPDYIERTAMRNKAREIVETSGWLDASGPPLKKKPSYVNSRYLPTPRQVGVNTCGLSVILNAWAYMLGIPIRPHNLRRAPRNDIVFLQTGLEIVNLAMAGCMDCRTIQAFMNVHGYSEEQDPHDEEAAVPNVAAVRMDLQRFGAIVHDLAKMAAWRAAGAHEPSEQAIEQQLGLANFATREQVRNALILEDNNQDAAALRIAQQSTPSPEPQHPFRPSK